jgi:putative PEP-CTERM system histidine kinase
MEFIGQWGHAVAASLYGALAVWLARRSIGESQSQGRVMAGAALATAIWALAVAMSGHSEWISRLTEHGRNLAWLAFMYALWRQGNGAQRSVSVAVLYGVLSAVIAVTASIDGLTIVLSGPPRLIEAAFLTSMILHMTVTVGALVLVHNLYTAATPDARAAIRLPMVGLAALWIYDLNLYTISYLSKGWAADLFELRGIAATLIAMIFALAVQRTQSWTIQLSRSVAFQSLSLVAIGGYLVFMVLVTSALELIGGDFVRTVQVAFVFGASVAALVLLPSAKFRSWFRVKVAKHLFRHRYDYRAEWLRFTDTIGRPGEGALPLESRIIQAVADVTESPGGLLLVPDEVGGLVAYARWNWPRIDPPSFAASAEIGAFFVRTGRVVELDALREKGEADEDEAAIIPEWMLGDRSAWAVVPLVHFDRLAGLVLLERPPISRTLDWEDFDLLRVVGRQVASYLAEARGQEELSDVRRFDEFNRRFAFIMHDVKNLVSQLTLVTRNAERHADNPEFRADMIATLQNSTARMNDLLARLSQHNKGRIEDPRPVLASSVIDAVAGAKRGAHPVVIAAGAELLIVADPARLEQALLHLLQNAIDASPKTEPVLIDVSGAGAEACIGIEDRGMGMSSAFVREKLFKPFTSTKEGGFGIGAYEARSLIAAMNGRIEVTSREGRGTRFKVFLPLAAAVQNAHPETSQAEAA